MVVEVRAPQPGDAVRVAQQLRAADRLELQAAGLTGPREWRDAIEEGIAHSPLCWTATVNRTPAAVFGCRPLPELGVAAPWFLGTDAVLRQRRAFVRLAPAYIDSMLATYPLLRNAAHAENREALRWLRAAGFELGAPFEVQSGARFIEFTRRG